MTSCNEEDHIARCLPAAGPVTGRRAFIRLATLGAGVALFYGAAPKLEDVPRIRAPLMLQFAGNDERINAMWPPYEAALKAAHAKYEAFVYPGVEHGFNNDTTPRFDARAAGLAWQRTLAFFAQNLRSA